MLEEVLRSQSVTTVDALHRSLQQQGLSDRPLSQDQKHVPSFSKVQLRQAMLVVLNDY